MTWIRVVAAVLLFQGAASDGRPLPDPQPFLEAVRQNLVRSQDLQMQFAYVERRTDLSFNPFGRVGTGGTRVFEVSPSADGSAVSRRLVERNGKPVVDGAVERIERRVPRGPSFIDDVTSTIQLAIDRRDVVDGRPMVVVTFTPRPDAKPRTREGRIARAFKGVIWIDEEAQEVSKVEATAIDDISFGYGLLARLSKGSSVLLRRQPIEGALWLPVSVRFTGEGRALLFRKLTINFAVDWFNYRRYSSSSVASWSTLVSVSRASAASLSSLALVAMSSKSSVSPSSRSSTA